MTVNIILTVILLLLNGFFVAAEFAIVKVRLAQVDVKASSGNRFAQIAKHIVEHLDSYLSATQLGITMTSLGLGWLGESVFSSLILGFFNLIGIELDPELAHKIAFPLAFALLTVLHIVIGELAPKSIAINYPLLTALTVSVPLKVFYTIFSPVIWTLNKASNLLLRIIGINTSTSSDIHSEEELKLILTESEEGGAIEQSEHDLIQNVFEFDDRIVRQVLVPRIKISAINISSSNEEIIQKVINEGYSRFPVYQDNLDDIIGIVHTRDFLKLLRKDTFPGIKKILRPAYFIPMTKKINALLKELQTQHIQMAIVTNEFGGIAGLVTMEDIIEELVGEIQDEHDQEKPFVVKVSDTEFILNAQSPISDVNDLIPNELPESPDYETISGLMNFIFGRIPTVNETRDYEGYRFTILKRQRHNVDSVKIVVLSKKEAEDNENEDKD
jgi:magnesium and cobalt exporter, CNNM family